MDKPQNILSLDICSTADSQIEVDLAAALQLLRVGIEHVTTDRLALDSQRVWASKAKTFVERFPDFPAA